jgi:type I restriction enzyme S subunit
MRKYEEYVDSKLTWLYKYPSSWSIKRIKDIFNILDYKRIPLSGVERGLMKNPIYDYYGASGVIDKVDDYIFDGTFILIGEDGANLQTRSKPLAFLAEGKFWVNNHAHILNTKKIYSIRYMVYALENLDYSIYITGAAQPKLSQENLTNIFVQVPSSFAEQQAIANYLDAKTSAIDKKVTLLEQKIETYKQLKRTLINQTITKGLRSLREVEMKDSGVNYISKVPSNWKIERIKELFKIGRGRVIGQLELIEDGKYPVYSSQTENNGCLGFIETYDFDGDLLTWTTDGANAGTVFRRSGKFNCTNVCGTLRPIRNNLDLNYMVYALQESAIHNKRIDTNGAKIMNNEMALIKVPLPPKSEQEEIAKYLDNKTATINAIVSNISKQIDTLKQLRKTLINDVVTGKIKVVE